MTLECELAKTTWRHLLDLKIVTNQRTDILVTHGIRLLALAVREIQRGGELVVKQVDGKERPVKVGVAPDNDAIEQVQIWKEEEKKRKAEEERDYWEIVPFKKKTEEEGESKC